MVATKLAPTPWLRAEVIRLPVQLFPVQLDTDTNVQARLPLPPVTDLPHVRNAMVMALSLETLPLQQDIDKLATKACEAVLVRGDNEKLYACFKLSEVSIFVAVMYVNQC